MDQRHLIVAITGGSGSGKTDFIRRLRAGFRTEEVCIISQDDYTFPRDRQAQDARGIPNFDRPDAIDQAAFRHDVATLLQGESVTRQEYNFNNPLAVLPCYESQIRPYRETCDLIINNDRSFETGLQVLCAFVPEWLRNRPDAAHADTAMPGSP